MSSVWGYLNWLHHSLNRKHKITFQSPWVKQAFIVTKAILGLHRWRVWSHLYNIPKPTHILSPPLLWSFRLWDQHKLLPKLLHWLLHTISQVPATASCLWWISSFPRVSVTGRTPISPSPAQIPHLVWLRICQLTVLTCISLWYLQLNMPKIAPSSSYSLHPNQLLKCLRFCPCLCVCISQKSWYNNLVELDFPHLGLPSSNKCTL